MSEQDADPVWLTWVEPEVVDLTDDELADYIAYWHARGAGYRQQRESVDTSHPEAYRWGHSAWWCSKKESIGLREIERRRIRRDRGKQQ